MELSEVVSAHFAVPVVGVVVCAVLVFAFGFKAPVQPPSFDLLNDDDDRKYKKSRQKKHKTNLDGHVIYIDGHGSPGTRAAAKQQVATNKQLPNEKYDFQIAKMKTKKTKLMMDFETSNEHIAEEQNVEATGEWTMAVSKKERKNRGKKDECTRAEESTPLTHEIPKVTHVANSNQAAVNSREASNRADEVTSNRSYRKSIEVTVTAPAPVPPSERLTCNIASPELDSPPVNAIDCINATKTTVVRVSVATGSAVTVAQSVKTKSPHVKTQKSETDIRLSGGDLVKTSARSSGASSQSGADLAKNCTSGIFVGGGKSTPSPKKKKKSPESREKYKEVPVVTIPGDAKGSALVIPKVVVKAEKSDIKQEEIKADQKAYATDSEAKHHGSPLQTADSVPSGDTGVGKVWSATGIAAEPLVDDPRPAEVNSACDAPRSDECQPSSDNPSPDESQTSAIAEEHGDWQQAKPLKKKRKPQKENWE